jgi:hypothetical protein
VAKDWVDGQPLGQVQAQYYEPNPKVQKRLEDLFRTVAGNNRQ